jgi:proline dehydrogenase
LAALAQHINGLKPLLDSAEPDQWTAQGAPEAYQAQWKAVADEIGYASRTSGELSADPERLSLALELYFRVQSLDQMAESLNAGIRKYQSPELADLIRERLSGASAAREKIRQYIVLLAAVKEGQFKVMDEEAQRCRGTLSRQAPARGGRAPQSEKK